MTEFNSKIKKNSRILKIFMFSICALFACAISSHAQSLVKGTVTDGIGEPLPGVSVVVKGTTNGTITDVNGKYSIQATAKDILSFSYVGMSDQEIKVAGQTTINVVMKDDVAALDEVRSKRIELRVTADELKKIHERMEEAGISSLTAYLVRMALHGYVIVMDLSDLKEILRLLQISGNNLNQYAKKANETGSIYHEDIEELKTNQKEILQEMRKVLDRLTAIM